MNTVPRLWRAVSLSGFRARIAKTDGGVPLPQLHSDQPEAVGRVLQRRIDRQRLAQRRLGALQVTKRLKGYLELRVGRRDRGGETDRVSQMPDGSRSVSDLAQHHAQVSTAPLGDRAAAPRPVAAQ